MKYLLRMMSLIAIMLVLMGTSASLKAQPHSNEFWIVVSDSDSPPTSSTLWFGDYEGSTYGIDGQLNPTIIEQDYPPPSFTFDTRFIDIPSRAAANALLGGIKPYNFQPIPTNALVRDTFNISFADGDRLGADFTFQWPDRNYLAARCDSMIFRYRYSQTDIDGNTTVFNIVIRMFDQTSAVITRPQDVNLYDSKITNVLIIKYGAHNPYVDGVRQESPAVPAGFALHQNYPNPFNPTTTVKFDILQHANTNISVYNIIGQKVSTLLSANLTPGTYSATWNGTSDQGIAVSSGVYFIRMTAEGFDGRNDRFSALRKIVLMK